MPLLPFAVLQTSRRLLTIRVLLRTASLLTVAQAMPSMCGAGYPVPCDEDARKACLNSLGILDTPTELQFDRITSLVSTVFACPIALVSFVDTERQ